MRFRPAACLLVALSTAISVSVPGCEQEPVATPPATTDAVDPAAAPPPVIATAPDASDTPASPATDNAVPHADEAEGGSTPEIKSTHRRANRLAGETSPYLLLHAHNPVDWFPWGPEALEKARREEKPIFLSIGYSSCYWCHVMERLVFENEEIARYMNENFVNIKVDREERPDIDEIYMLALQVYLQMSGSGGGGGWPLSMFLTPDGQPIAGGTYFPPDDKDGRRGFPSVMSQVKAAWTDQREPLFENANLIARIVRQEMEPKLNLQPAELTRELVASAVSSVIRSHDSEFGGVDFKLNSPNSPKFPVPVKLALLQYEIRERKNPEAEHVLYHTLDAMSAGGIRDHLGGGFHRYSTDRRWLVPHFEKMLYDNAQLGNVYTEAFRATNDPTYRETAEEIFDFLLTDMLDSRGGYHSALDAETDAIEGLYYVWSMDEIDQALGADAALFKQAFGVAEPSPFEHGFVLHQPQRIDQLAADVRIAPNELRVRLFDLRRTLLEIRRKRDSPLKDDKVLTSWNGLTITALANAGIVFGRQKYLDAAENAAMFILTNMRDSEGHLFRTYRGGEAKLNGYLDDYAFLIEALLELQRATSDPDNKWLNAAQRLADDQLKMFADDARGGFYFTSHGHEKLLARTMSAWDSVLPSGNSVSVRNLIRLASLTGKAEYREYASKTLNQFAHLIEKNPRGTTNLAIALGEFLDNRDYRPLLQQIDRTNDAAPAAPIPPSRPASQPAPAEPNAPVSATPIGSDSANAKPAIRARPDRVSATAYLSTDRLPAGSQCRVAVVLTIAENWHINANPASPDFLIPTTVTMRSTLGTSLKDVRYPAGGDLKLKGTTGVYRVYDGRITVFGDLVIPADAGGKTESFELQIRYQACNDEQCEQPKTLIFAGQVTVADPDVPVGKINAEVFTTGVSGE
jgi:uncharacterized protein YyaL (SSP411 family)